VIDAFEQHERNVLNHARRESAQAEARLAGMKIRARLDPPKAAPWVFPYYGRTCAEWR
jgi:hypothetical protein